MGFWQGINRGFTAVQEEKARKRERQQEIDLRKAEREEIRAYERGLWNEKILHEQTMATVPLIIEKMKERDVLAGKRSQLGAFFETRLEDVPDETRTAFTNLALQDPTYSEALIEAVQKAEAPGQLGRRMSGAEILKMSRIFEQTKPENVTLEDWTRQAANMTVTTDSGIDFDATIERLFSGDVSLEDVQRTQMEILMPSSSGMVIRPDFDLSAVMGGDPQTKIQLKSLAVDTMKTQFQSDFAKAQEEANKFQESGEAPTEEWKETYKELGRIAALPADERDNAIFNFYAPIILPRLAEQEPRFKTLFPEVFQSPTTGGSVLTEDDLRYIGMQ